ncbi:MAG: hypothetical protein ACYDHX_12385 [Methanothrix sp.]
MDPFTIAAVVSSMLAPYLAKGGEAFASEFGKSAGQKIGELSDLVKNRFKGDKEAEIVLDLAEKNPQSKARVASLEEEIGKMMKADPDFAKKLSALMEQVQETESGKIVIKAYNKSVIGKIIIGSTISTGDHFLPNSKEV